LRVRWTSLALLGAFSLALVAGCDGGPGFNTRLYVTNQCGEDIAFRTQSGASPAPGGSTWSEGVVLAQGKSVVVDIADIREPGRDIAHRWVVPVGAPSWGESIAFGVEDLNDAEGPNHEMMKALPIQGDLCP
jgi:hypothetical protein